jgi:nucleotide-binding universal stress UspA family protein
MELKRILWPTDSSENAEQALPYVSSLSEKFSSEVHVLYVIEELAYHESWYGEFDRAHMEKIHKWEERKAKERLDQICESYLKGCPLYVRHIAIGDPAEEILRIIDGRKDHEKFPGSGGYDPYQAKEIATNIPSMESLCPQILSLREMITAIIG